MTPAQPMPTCPTARRPVHGAAGQAWRLVALAAGMALAGCGRGGDVTQVAARVNDADVTVHQVNFALQQQDRALRPEQVDAASRRVLESLIDQELAVQKSVELQLDRDPQVVQALEAARREVLARAYRERISQDGARPAAQEVRRFFDATPALFAQRRVYTLQELLVDAPAARLPWLKQRLAEARSAEDFTDALRAEGLRFTSSPLVKPAEQLPMPLVEPLAKLQPGQAAVVADGPPARVLFITDARLEPMGLERAAPAIEQYLATQARRRAIDDNLQALRTAARIRYHGKFAAGAASAPGAAAPPVQLVLPETSPEPVKLDMPAPPPAPESAGSAIDPNLAKKGMGLK